MRTEVKVNTMQYNKIIVSEFEIEFIPIYDSQYHGMTVVISDREEHYNIYKEDIISNELFCVAYRPSKKYNVKQIRISGFLSTARNESGLPISSFTVFIDRDQSRIYVS